VVDSDLEVVWPLHKWHYLSPSLQDPETDMADDVTVDPPTVSAPGRDLAARALVAGAACTQQRVSDLLETSRRSVGRAIKSDLAAALHDAAVIAEARTVLAQSARRGSTAEEREAADTWLAQAPHLPPRGPKPSANGRPRLGPTEANARSHGRRHKSAPTPVARPGLALEHIHALTAQQQRIERRTLVLGCAVGTVDAAPLREALTDLLADITEAARTIGRIVSQATR
jgi:hypothetical protein